jgi:heptaprenyl diphosphate synthase
VNINCISPTMLECAEEILKWARETLAVENEHLHRPRGNQVVCPFVGPAIETDSFYLAFHPEVTQHSARLIEQIMVSYIPEFGHLWPFEPSDRLKKALLVVFPHLPARQTRVLDQVYTSIKNKFVAAGLMVGQFHQNCDVPSVYNRACMVSRSPVPLMAVRHMAIHDILFLGENEEWFQEYNVRFGHRFQDLDKVESFNKHLVEYYLKAKARFSL